MEGMCGRDRAKSATLNKEMVEKDEKVVNKNVTTANQISVKARFVKHILCVLWIEQNLSFSVVKKL